MTTRAADASKVMFEAVITPHRSMGARGLRWVAGILLLLSLVVTVGVWLLGAWPVVGFTGGEVVLAVWLLHRHALGQRASEMVMLSEDGLRIIRADPAGRRTEFAFPAAWLRASLEDRPGRTPALMLRSRGQAVEIAALLGEQEKRDLLTALDLALYRQRHPVFENPGL